MDQLIRRAPKFLVKIKIQDTDMTIKIRNIPKYSINRVKFISTKVKLRCKRAWGLTTKGLTKSINKLLTKHKYQHYNAMTRKKFL